MSDQQHTVDPEQDARPVVVIGGGVGGSAAAAVLARAGVPVTVLERHAEPGVRPRAWVLSAQTMELFRGLGVDDAVRTLGSPGSWDVQVVETLRDVPADNRVEDPSASISPSGAAMCDQDVLEGILRRHAVDRGADFRSGETVTALVDEGGAVEVRCDSGLRLRARYVIDAEGAGGALARTVGIELVEPPHEEFIPFDQVLFRSADLDRFMADRPGKAFACPRSGVAVFRRDLDRWQVHRQNGTFGDVGAEIDEVVGQHVEIEVLDHSSWRPSAHLAHAFRAGNVFLIGDTAHSMPPSRGMGANLAIADAHNLAWKLAWVLDGRAGGGLLDSYEQERRPVDAFVTEQSVAAIGATDPGSTRVPFHRVAPVEADPEGLWLVRPDGYVGARTRAADLDDVLDSILDRAAG